MKCRYWRCPERGTAYARQPLPRVIGAVPVEVSIRLHPYCTRHLHRIEKRYGRMVG